MPETYAEGLHDSEEVEAERAAALLREQKTPWWARHRPTRIHSVRLLQASLGIHDSTTDIYQESKLIVLAIVGSPWITRGHLASRLNSPSVSHYSMRRT
jgi:hypothetical protein